MSVTCFLGVGSNLGDRRKFIKAAVKEVNSLKGTKVIKVSKIIQTKPVGGPQGQGRFLNAALKIKTNLAPLALLRKLKTIEKQLGRINSVRNGPRTIDLDILFYGDRVINNGELKIPHPKVFKRLFVIKSLLEVI